jgi:hypothetical protein
MAFNLRTFVLLTLATTLTLAAVLPGSDDPNLIVRQNAGCKKWPLTIDAWKKAGTDKFIATTFQLAKANGERFDTALGRSTGYIDLRCRIGDVAGCAVDSCKGRRGCADTPFPC